MCPRWSGCGLVVVGVSLSFGYDLVGVGVARLWWVWPCFSGHVLVGLYVALLVWVCPFWRECGLVGVAV